MTDPTARDLIQRLADNVQLWLDYCVPPSLPQVEDESFLLLQEARAYLAQLGPDGPAVPDGREPASVVYEPSDDEERFEHWWYHEGSAPPRPEHDLEEHTHWTSKIAWLNGAYCARYSRQKVAL